MELPDSSDAFSSFEVGFRLTEELIKRHRNFTALMAFDDLAAFGAIRALSKAGIRVPEQCSVIGFVLVFIMLAGEKGIWGSLQPLLEKLLFRKKAAAGTAESVRTRD